MTITIIHSLITLVSIFLAVYYYLQYRKIKKEYAEYEKEVLSNLDQYQISYFTYEKEIRELKIELGRDPRLSPQK
jgi:cbb3-type cytochrome oxidase subunit 3